jgi:hypothetical protein
MDIGKQISLVVSLHLLLFHTLIAATDIVKYNIVQTTPKIQLGGVKEDFLSELYHCLFFME